MSLSLFTPLLCSPAAQADNYPGGYPGGGSGSGGSGGSGGGYPGGSGGSGYPGSAGWVAQPAVVNGVTYPAAVSGTVTVTFTDAQGHTTSGTGDYHNDGSSPPPLSVNAGESLTYKVNGKVVYTWKWNGGPNNLPPPPTQCVLETATAGAYGGGDVNGTVTVTASDGGIGTENKVDSVSDDGKTQTHSDGFGGAQLVTMDGSSGTLTVTGTVQAECDLSEPKSGGGYPGGGYPGGGYPGSGGSGSLHGNAGCYFTAALDTRGVIISTDIDPTYQKDPDSKARVQNQRSPTGALKGDTLVPPSGSSSAINYLADVLGSWSYNSQGSWSSVLNPFGPTFFFPDFSGGIAPLQESLGSIQAGFVDPVSIQLTDSAYGVTASNSYTMRFHDEVENWFHDTSKDIIHPTPTIPTNDNYDSGDHAWQRYGPTTGGYDFKEANGSKQSNEVKVGAEGEIAIDSPITLAFKANEDVTQGQEFSADTEHEWKADLPNDGTYIVYYGPGWEEHSGTMDLYGLQGFRGVFPWSDTKWQLDPSGHIAIRIIPVKYPSK